LENQLGASNILRILIPNHFPLQGSGSGIYVLNVAQELSRIGHEVLVIVPENEQLEVSDYPFDVDVIPFTGGGGVEAAELDFNFPCFTTHPRSVQTFYDLDDGQLAAYLAAWRKHIGVAIRDFSPDIIHAHHVWIAPYIASDFHIPFVITVHGTDLMGFRKGPRYREMALEAAKRADGLIAISHQVADDAEVTYGVPPERIHLIWNGFDVDIFKVLPEVSKIDLLGGYGIDDGDDAPLVSFVGKFTDFKGIDVLLRAAAVYEQAIPGVQTLLVGHGQLWDDMHELVDQLNLENVHFAGHQPQDEVARIYNAAEVSVVPSRVEPFGLVAVEALACGTPVVATNMGGLPDFINEKVGALVPVDDPGALAEAIIEEIKGGTKKTKGVYASQYALEGFSWAGQVLRMVELYKQAIDAHESGE
jgi:glycosyltransferase involved in cell wall biosynthesis